MELEESGPLAEMMRHFASEGKVVWIGLRTGREMPVKVVEKVEVKPGEGLAGDRFSGRVESPRQVTLIQAEHLPAVASFLGRPSIDPSLLRRNIVVECINLLFLKGKPFRVGSVWLEMTGPCHPCSKMEKHLAMEAIMR